MLIGINKIDLENSKEKIRMYSKEEVLILDSIDKELSTINGIFKISELDNIKFELMKNFRVLKNNHYNDEMIIDRVIDKYIEASRKATKIIKG